MIKRGADGPYPFSARGAGRQLPGFEELVRYYDRGILRLILHLTGSQRDAREIYRKAFLRAYRELGHFQFETDFSIWIYRLATSLCMDELRRSKRRNSDAQLAIAVAEETHDRLDAADGPASRPARRELEERIGSAFVRLTPGERVVFELKHYHGLKLRTIALILCASEQAVKTWFLRATEKMRSELVRLR